MVEGSMSRKPDELTADMWELLYQQWLDGVSLNELARRSGLSCGRIVGNNFRHLYGQDATDVALKSFIRSLRADYPGNEWVMRLKASIRYDTRYYSQTELKNSAVKGIAKIKGNRSVEMSYRVAYYESIKQDDDPWQQLESERPLSLNFVITWLSVVCSLLYGVIKGSPDDIQLQTTVRTGN